MKNYFFVFSVLKYAISLTVIFTFVYSQSAESQKTESVVVKYGNLTCTYSNMEKDLQERKFKCEDADCEPKPQSTSEAPEWRCTKIKADKKTVDIDCKIRKSRIRRYIGGKKYLMECNEVVPDNRKIMTAPLVNKERSACPEGHVKDHNNECREGFD